MAASTSQSASHGLPGTAPRAGFLIAWDDPRDEKLTWIRNTKYPAPIPPLIHAIVAAFVAAIPASRGRDCPSRCESRASTLIHTSACCPRKRRRRL